MVSTCPLVTKPTQYENEKQELCGSILKQMEPSQKAIYDNFSNVMLLCPVDPKYTENTAGRVGSHEMCLRRYIINEHKRPMLGSEATEHEIEIMYRGTRLQKGPAGVSLWLEAFHPTCKGQADRITKTINVLKEKSWIEKDDHLHVSLIGHDCDESFGGLLDDVKERVQKVVKPNE